MKLVALESPFKGESQEAEAQNIEYARACMLDSLQRGEAPIVSHLLYTQALDDQDPGERKLGIEAGLAWGKHAEATVVYCDRGISEGMTLGILRAKKEGRAVKFRSLYSGGKNESSGK